MSQTVPLSLLIFQGLVITSRPFIWWKLVQNVENRWKICNYTIRKFIKQTRRGVLDVINVAKVLFLSTCLPPTGQWSTRDRDSTAGILAASREPSLTETHLTETPMRGRHTGLLLIKLCWLLMLLNDMYLVGLDFCVRKHTNNSFTKIKYPFQHDAWYSSTIPYWSKG